MEEKISKDKIIEFFRRVGWYENRKVDISEVEKYYQECNYPMFDSTKKFFQEFYNLKSYYDKETNQDNNLFYTNHGNQDGNGNGYFFLLDEYNYYETAIDDIFEYKKFIVDKSLKSFEIKTQWQDDSYILKIISNEPVQIIGELGFLTSSPNDNLFCIGKSGKLYDLWDNQVFEDIFSLAQYRINQLLDYEKGSLEVF